MSRVCGYGFVGKSLGIGDGLVLPVPSWFYWSGISVVR
ncbi:Uncharacterised protein [Mycobacteroides abscessus subsp. bolletii]|nr:Uncharacterised protein [Mycobacteroides abscessus subsp. bolletii]